MAKIDYHAIAAGIVAHLKANMDTAVNRITNSFSESVSPFTTSVSILVIWLGFTHNEEDSMTGGADKDLNRNARFGVDISVKSISDAGADELIDDTCSTVEELCNAEGHGEPPFNLSKIDGTPVIERSIATSAVKDLPEGGGLGFNMIIECSLFS